VTDDIEYLLGSGYKIIAMEKICAPAAPENLLIKMMTRLENVEKTFKV